MAHTFLFLGLGSLSKLIGPMPVDRGRILQVRSVSVFVQVQFLTLHLAHYVVLEFVNICSMIFFFLQVTSIYLLAI